MKNYKKRYEYIDNNGKRHPYVVYGEENKGRVVDIGMAAYNHGDYIAQALESILAQKTDYTYRIIIGEDCSTDLTRDIVMEYYHKYPDKITLILWEHNVGADINVLAQYKLFDGKYIANLEGDDYWTCPYKLEKQITFLEMNKDYIGISHNVRCVDVTGNLLHRDFGLYSIQDEHIYGIENVKRFELAGQMASMVYRNFWKDWDDRQWERYFQCKANGDVKINTLLGLHGDIFFMRDIMADHRRVFVGDSWTAKTAGRNMLWMHYQSRKNIQQYIKECFGMEMDLKNDCKAMYQLSRLNFMETVNLDNLRVFLKMLMEKIKIQNEIR